jgi:GSH-dependent disulfide-bond oxidoreductase
MLGQMGHFFKYAANSAALKDLSEAERSVRLEYGKARYLEESQRLFRVLDKQLHGKDFVCGNFSIADISIYPWAKGV